MTQARISSIIQDRQGFIWLGTLDGGLVRYDGYTFKTFIYNPKDSTSFSNNQVSIIFEDSKGRLWIGTTNVLNCYNKKNEHFSHISLRPDSSDNGYYQINDICEDSTGAIWVATTTGIFRLSFPTQIVGYYPEYSGLQIDHFLPVPEDIKNRTNNTQSLQIDRNGICWIGSEKELGQLIFNPKKNSELPSENAPSYYYLPFQCSSKQKNVFSTGRILKVVEDNNDTIWAINRNYWYK